MLLIFIQLYIRLPVLRSDGDLLWFIISIVYCYKLISSDRLVVIGVSKISELNLVGLIEIGLDIMES